MNDAPTIAEYRTVEAAGKVFLFVVPKSALFQVSRELVDALAASGETSSEVLAPWIGDLSEMGLLTGTRLADPIPEPGQLTTLVLNLTHACELHCAYCYGRERTPPHPMEMSVETAVAAVEFLFDRLPPGGPCGITFFGGEPLLNMAALSAAAQRAIELATDPARELRFAITTSALSLSPEAVSLLTALRARVTVSIDGDPGVHDAVRPARDGRGSYQRSVAGLRLLGQRNDVTGRATLTRRAPDPVAVVDHLLGLGLRRVGVSTADVTGDLAMDERSLGIVDDGMAALADRYLEQAAAGGHLPLSNLDGLLRTIHRGANRTYPCGAGLRLAACDTDGSLYLCHRMLGLDAYRTGHISSGFDGLGETVARLGLEQRPDCTACWARYLCGGGCHHAHHVAGSPTAALPVCPSIRRWMFRALEVYATLMVDHPQFIERFIETPDPTR